MVWNSSTMHGLKHTNGGLDTLLFNGTTSRICFTIVHPSGTISTRSLDFLKALCHDATEAHFRAHQWLSHYLVHRLYYSEFDASKGPKGACQAYSVQNFGGFGEIEEANCGRWYRKVHIGETFEAMTKYSKCPSRLAFGDLGTVGKGNLT
jgi:hypothetical protein